MYPRALSMLWLLSAMSGAQLSDWLHRTTSFDPHQPGERAIAVALDDGSTRSVFVRVPKNYPAQTRAWPIIIAYHGTGALGRDLVEPIVRLLGPEADSFLVAGVDQYQSNNVDSKRAWRPEYRLVFQELKRRFNIDSERVYSTGFSGGGYVAWSNALFYGDEFAACIPVESAFDAAPEIPGMWEMLLPNVSNTPVLNVWGSEDRLPVLGIDLQTPQGTNHELNQKLIPIAKRLRLPIESFCVTGGGHAFDPPREQFMQMLAKRRVQYPREVIKRFRYLNQARAYWLEGLSWHGDQWGLRPRELPDKPGETKEQAIAQMLESTLGSLRGKIDGNTITIHFTHLGEIKLVFDGPIRRDVQVAISQAMRTRDFDRIRWAGLIVNDDGDARVFDSTRDDLPEVVWAKPR